MFSMICIDLNRHAD